VGLTGLTGCLGGGDLGSGDGPIRIGAVQPFSGAFSSYSEPHQRGLEYAIEQINSEGGVLGRELDYVSEDSQSDPGQAASIFQRFVEQEDVAAVTGVVSSDVGIRTAQTAEQEEVPNILHVAASNEVLSKDSRYNFRTAMMATPNVGKAHADLIEDHGFTKIGGLMADYAAGDAIGEATERYVGNLDGVETHMEFAPLGESDFTSYLRQIPDDIDMMIASGHPPGAPTIISQQIELGTNPEMIRYLRVLRPGRAVVGLINDKDPYVFVRVVLFETFRFRVCQCLDRSHDDVGVPTGTIVRHLNLSPELGPHLTERLGGLVHKLPAVSEDHHSSFEKIREPLWRVAERDRFACASGGG